MYFNNYVMFYKCSKKLKVVIFKFIIFKKQKIMTNFDKIKSISRDLSGNLVIWDNKEIMKFMKFKATSLNLNSIDKLIKQSDLYFDCFNNENLFDENKRKAKKSVLDHILNNSLKNKKKILYLSTKENKNSFSLFANDTKQQKIWVFNNNKKSNVNFINETLQGFLKKFSKNLIIFPTGKIVETFRLICLENQSNTISFSNLGSVKVALEIYDHGLNDINNFSKSKYKIQKEHNFSHLNALEEEAIYIMREAVSEARKPVMLYSLGKDSSVMLHLAKKAFYPSSPAFPLLHIDTGWKFQSMYDFRDYIVKKENLDLLVFKNPEGEEKNINPFTNGSSHHTDIMKTQGLKLALNKYKFDVAFGGARRDEEKSRAKERIFSFRNENHQWMSNKQRPELWRNYNGFKNNNETIRVFPLSNWTELDIWLYIYKENIPVVPLYFSQERPVIDKDGVLLMVDDDRMIADPKNIKIKKVRFRTLGGYPLTGAFESLAYDVPSIIMELIQARTSERQNRMIDNETNSSMESKKEEGYF